MGSVKNLSIIEEPTESKAGVGIFEFSDRYSVFDWGDYYGLHNYILMQFTGLHDKNGKEIYEGDVVLADMGLIQREQKKVAWGGHWDYAGFGLHGKRKEEMIQKWGEHPYTWDALNPELARACEIIGNIYENPELCEQSVNKEKRG